MSELSTIYSYGAGEVLYYIFNAIAMLFNSGFMVSLLNFTFFLALLWAGINAGIKRESNKEYIKWFLSYLFVSLVLIQPANLFPNKGMIIHIRDIVTNKAYKVDHIPPGLGISASLINSIGFVLTKNFETIFSLVDHNYLEYHKYGSMFAAHIISEVKNFKIQNPLFKENIESYITNCMLYDVMIGKKYDIQELKNSNNIWSILTQYSSSLRMFNYRKFHKGGRELITCKAGIIELEKYFLDEIPLLGNKFPLFTRVFKKQNTQIKITDALDVTMKFYGHFNNQSAEDHLKQLLIINAFKAIPYSYGNIRALQQQNTSWQFMGELAQLTLPIMHALFQALIYASFPLVVCFIFFSRGFHILATYFGIMIWIELWAPLFAVLNLIISLFAKNAMLHDGFTIENISHIISTQHSYAMAASSLGMAIPVLSYMLVKGGAGSFVHIAGQISGMTSTGISVAATEVVSGNRTLDHLSIGDKSLNNVNTNKYDTAANFSSGYMRSSLLDGTIKTDLMNGKVIYQGGPGITSSSGNTTLNIGSTMQESLVKQFQKNYSKAINESHELSQIEQNMTRQASEFVARFAENKAKGEHYDISDAVSENQTFNEVINKTKDLHENYGYSWSQASNYAITGGLTGGFDIGGHKDLTNNPFTSSALAKFGYNIAGKIGVDGNYQNSNINTENWGENKTVSARNENAHLLESVIKASNNINYSDSQSQEKNLADSMQQSYEVMEQKRNNIAYYQSKAENAQSTMDKISNINLNSNANVYDELLEYISIKPNKQFQNRQIGINKAREIIEEAGPEFYKYKNDFTAIKLQQMNLINGFEEEYNNVHSATDHLSIETQQRIQNHQIEQNHSSINKKEINNDIKPKFQKMKDEKLQNINKQKIITNDVAIKIKDSINTFESSKVPVYRTKKNTNQGNWDE